MPTALLLASGPQAGRRVPIEAGKPRTFKVLKQGVEAGSVAVELLDGQCVVTNRSERPLLVNGQERQRSVLVDGDEVVIGKDTFRIAIEDDGPTTRSFEQIPADPSTTAPPAVTEGQRRRRSLSAESGSLPTEGRPGLLSRVSTAISTRAERGREEELQRQRQDLLALAGRRALAGDRFGLNAATVADLLAGRAVRVDPTAIDQAALSWWRSTRDQLVLLDAEIAALRQAVGLGPDPGALNQPALRQELRTQEERTYSALDGLTTQPLDSPDLSQAPTVAVSSISARRRAVPTRRTR